MKRTRIAVLLLALGAPAFAGKDPGGPMAQLKQNNDKIDRILKKKVPAGTPEEQAAKTELKTAVNSLIDYRELAERALAEHWGKLTPAQRDQFVSTLRELIEKNYVRQLRSNLDYDIVYKDEKLLDSEALVTTLVKVRTKGKSTDTSIDYKMRRAGDKWMVYDVITDDVSMLRNYRNQFNKIITQESYDALIKKMRKKIEENDAPDAQRTAR